MATKLSKEEIEEIKHNARNNEQNADQIRETEISAALRELNEDKPDDHDNSLRSIDMKTDLTEEQILAFTSIDFGVAGGALPIGCSKITQVSKRLAKSKHGKGIDAMVKMANSINADETKNPSFFQRLMGAKTQQ